MKTIYCDHNATTTLHNHVSDAMITLIKKNMPYNSSSIHKYGQEAKNIIEEARKYIKKSFGAISYNDNKNISVIFCATGTEANNLALKGKNWKEIIISSIEHSSVAKCRKDSIILNVDSDGIVNINQLEEILYNIYNNIEKNEKFLVSISLANGEIGIIQKIQTIAKLTHKYNGVIHTDASQAFGKIPVNFFDLGVDMMTISGHKFGGPIGSAALVLQNSISLYPIIDGGGQEMGMRSGTLNIISIHGLGVACSIINEINNNWSNVELQRNKLEDLFNIDKKNLLHKPINSEIKRLPNTISVRIPGIKSDVQVAYFDRYNICVSSGPACSSGTIKKTSSVYLSLGYENTASEEFIRISLGPGISNEDLYKINDVWQSLKNKYVK
ncbi:cysteine desulfurase family protein [Lyticum sinuosum]|uniref:Cysteine desulfurase n=1 Tax=Lyticum sinuosum TaxID=1332059 RepID=A0AAE5AH01_9RICK|nr:aminotransferase class V-fold PLP-dependent enzyme [Lyticum sinuosum]MDZ5761402.1 Cysteine desulfurase [Lyticum sinuosum]